jgi:rubredoxin
MAEALAEQLALEKLQAEGTTTFICEVCGYVAKGADPVRCPVCSSGPERFVKIDQETVEAMVAEEGGTESDEAFDGVRLRWTLEAKEELRRVPVAYMRRRAKARIEKSARVRRLATITRDFVQPIVDESIIEGEAIGAAPAPEAHGTKSAGVRSAEAVSAEGAPSSTTVTIQLGTFAWTQEAVNRLNRVPEGFMRDMTREKIEDYARLHGILLVTLEVAEKGIEVGRQLMAEMIAGYSQVKRVVGPETPHAGQGTSAAAAPTSVLNEVSGV